MVSNTSAPTRLQSVCDGALVPMDSADVPVVHAFSLHDPCAAPAFASVIHACGVVVAVGAVALDVPPPPSRISEPAAVGVMLSVAALDAPVLHTELAGNTVSE